MLFQERPWLEGGARERCAVHWERVSKPLEPQQHGSLSPKFLAARWQHFPWDCLILSQHTKLQLTVDGLAPCGQPLEGQRSVELAPGGGRPCPSSLPVCLCFCFSLFHTAFPSPSRSGMSVLAARKVSIVLIICIIATVIMIIITLLLF